MPRSVALSLILAFAGASSSQAACGVRLRHAVPTCPAVTYSPDDCGTDLVGKPGGRLASGGTIHKMKGGFAYYCAGGSGCVEVGSLEFKGCRMKPEPRHREESPEYLSHVLVD